MPAQVMQNRIVPALGVEKVSIMDDYGTEFHLYIQVNDTANRASLIAAALAQQSANETALEHYAASVGTDISGLKAVGLAKRATALKAVTPTTPAPAATN